MKNVNKTFITGLLTALPISVTVWVVYKIFIFLDSIIGSGIYKALGVKIPGLGIVVSIILIYLVGLITGNYLGKKIQEWVEKLFERLPLFKSIFVPIKDMMKNFSSKNSSNFKKTVLMKYPMKGSHSMGFITKENVKVGDVLMTIVFVPTTPNPTSGFLMYATPDMYQELDIPVNVALKTIVSLGTISPEYIAKKEN